MYLLHPDIHMCNRHVSPAPIVEILFSRYRTLLLSCSLDRVVMYSEKVNYCSCFGIFLLKSKQVTREVHFAAPTSSEVGPLLAYDSTTVSSYLETLNS